MTEESFQQGRKFMQQANHLRGLITAAKGGVAKWSNIEASFREQLKPTQADGAKKMLDKALKKLDTLRAKFAEMKFPENNLSKEIIRCRDCGVKIPEGTHCDECI